MNKEQLSIVLKDHASWLKNEGGCRADLRGTNLRYANLRDADSSGANLSDADLSGAKIDALTSARLAIVPEGTIIGWKKLAGGIICKLEIPTDAKRSNATGRKCRANMAKVLDGKGVSQYDPSFSYEPGKTVVCNKWDPDRWVECGGGIHFFLTREEAEAY